MEEFSQEFDEKVMSGGSLAEESPAPVENEPTDEKPHVVAEESTPEAQETEPDKVVVEESKPKNGYEKRINKLTRKNKEKAELIDAQNQRIQELEQNLASIKKDDSIDLVEKDFGDDKEAWNNYKIDRKVNEKLAEQEKKVIESEINKSKKAIEQTKQELDREKSVNWNEQLNERSVENPDFAKKVQEAQQSGFDWGRLQPSLMKLPNGVDVAEAIATNPQLQSMVENTDSSLLTNTLLTIGFMNQSKPKQQKQIQQKKPIPSTSVPKASKAPQNWADYDKEYAKSMRR